MNGANHASRALLLIIALRPLPLNKVSLRFGRAVERPRHTGLNRANHTTRAVPLVIALRPLAGFDAALLFRGAVEGSRHASLDGADVASWAVLLGEALGSLGGRKGREAENGREESVLEHHLVSMYGVR